MPANTNEASLPANVDPEAIRAADVDGFMQTVSAWARALLHLVLAAAATAEHPDVSAYLAGFPVPNPGDVVVAATGAAEGAQSDAVVGPGAEALAGDLSEAEAVGAAGGALARSLLNNWGAR